MDQVSKMAGGCDDDRSSHSGSSWCLVDERGDDSQDDGSQHDEEHEGSASIISDITSGSSSNDNASSISSYLSQVLLASQISSGSKGVSPVGAPQSSQFLPELAADSDDHSSVALTRGSSICTDDDEQETDTGEETGEDEENVDGSLRGEDEDLCVVDEGALLEESRGASARFIEPGRVAKKLDELAECFDWKWMTLRQFATANPKLWLPLIALAIALIVACASLVTMSHSNGVDEITPLASYSLAPTFERLSTRKQSNSNKAPSAPTATIAHGDSGLQYREIRSEEVVVSRRIEEPRPKRKRRVGATVTRIMDVDIPTLETRIEEASWEQIAKHLQRDAEDAHELEQCREDLDDAKTSFKSKSKLLQYFRLKEIEQELRIRDLEKRLAVSEFQLKQQLSADVPINEHNATTLVVDSDVATPPSPDSYVKHAQGKGRRTVRLLDRDIDEKVNQQQPDEKTKSPTVAEDMGTCLRPEGLLSNLTRSFLSALNRFPYVNSTSSTLRRLINAEYLVHLNNMKQLSSWLHNHSSQFIKRHGPTIRQAKEQVKDRAIQLWEDLPSKLSILKASVPEVVSVVKRGWMSHLEPLVTRVETAVTVFKDHLGGVNMSPVDGDTDEQRNNEADVDGEVSEDVEECSGVQIPMSVNVGRGQTTAADVGKDEKAAENNDEQEESGEWIYNRAKRRHEMRRNSSILLRLEKRANWRTDWQWQRAHNRQKHRDDPPTSSVRSEVEDSWLFSREHRREEARNSKLDEGKARQQKVGKDVRKKDERDWLLDRGRHRSNMRKRHSKGVFHPF